MNPSAQAFVPKKKGSDSNNSSNNATKLSAAAMPFVPPKKSKSGSEPATPPQKDADAAPAANTHHVDPADAKPKAPAVPPAAIDAELSTKATETKGAESGLAPLSAPLSAAEQLEKQIAELPPAEPLDWSKSRLPALFGCHNTKAKATSEPIRLNTTWVLYADDHGAVGTPLGAGAGSPSAGSANATSFDPLLVSTVSDVESFWRLWRYVPAPSSCPVPFTYSWFRHDIKPEWEHPRNKRGGIITIVVYDRDKVGLNDPQVLDDVWMATLTGCAGESFAESATMLNGAMLKLRANNRPVTMQLWFANSDSTKLRAFANSFRDAIGKIMGAKWLQKLEFYSHNQKQSANNTLAARMSVKPKISPDFTF